MTNNLETRRRRLRYRTSHTGTKETDIILGEFVEKFGSSLDSDEIRGLEKLLEHSNDPEVFSWIIGRESVPKGFDTPVLERIVKFVADRNSLCK